MKNEIIWTVFFVAAFVEAKHIITNGEASSQLRDVRKRSDDKDINDEVVVSQPIEAKANADETESNDPHILPQLGSPSSTLPLQTFGRKVQKCVVCNEKTHVVPYKIPSPAAGDFHYHFHLPQVPFLPATVHKDTDMSGTYAYVHDGSIVDCEQATKDDAVEPGPIGQPGQPGQRGQPGDKGDQGIAGSPGNDGAPGSPGLLGPTGPVGPNGLPGPAGQPGQPGDKGDQGIAGPPGNDGAPGSPGLQGFAGRPGSNGSPGPAGQAGQPGDKGDQGIAGLPGNDGAPGSPGLQGFAG